MLASARAAMVAFGVAACSLSVLGAGVAVAADSTTKKLPPSHVLEPVSLVCFVSGSSASARVFVRNSTSATIAQGRQIGWRTGGGAQGAFDLRFPLERGKTLLVGSGAGPGCSAWLQMPTLPIEVQ
jgi:hypothetical protein